MNTPDFEPWRPGAFVLPPEETTSIATGNVERYHLPLPNRETYALWLTVSRDVVNEKLSRMMRAFK